MLNSISLMGRITRDPELKYTPSEKPVTSFTLAVDRDGKDAGVDFLDCVAWEANATLVDRFFKKGNLMIVRGRLRIKEWMGKDEAKKRAPEIVVERVYFVEKKSESNRPVGAGPSSFTDIDDEQDGILPF